jgi:Putative Ig domain/Concanavalin A-like lectin/glucanases superfamily
VTWVSLVRRRIVPALALGAAVVPVAITQALGQSPAGADTYDSTVLADHPVAFWDMTPTGGSESDLTGGGHNGTYRGGTPSLATMPNGNQAVDFNGNREYMTVPSSHAFSIPTTRELTWEGWIRPDIVRFTGTNDTEGYNYVDWLGKCQNYSPSCEWEARMYSSAIPRRCNRLSAYVFNPSAGLGSAADWQPNCGLIQAGQWLHVVGEYQTWTTPSQCDPKFPGTINIWVNGIEQDFARHEPTGCMSEHSIVPRVNSSPLDIGTMALETWFPGAVGKVAIYNYLLTPSQVDTHYVAMTSAQPSGNCAWTCTFTYPNRSAGILIMTRSLPLATSSARYSETLAATGGNLPYRWSVSSGKLPPGLHLRRATGIISGRPNKRDVGIYTFTVMVLDRKVRVRPGPPTQDVAAEVLSIAIS